MPLPGLGLRAHLERSLAAVVRIARAKRTVIGWVDTPAALLRFVGAIDRNTEREVTRALEMVLLRNGVIVAVDRIVEPTGRRCYGFACDRIDARSNLRCG